MAVHTLTAMFHRKDEAERAAHRLKTDTALAVTNVKILPEDGRGPTAEPQEHGFLASLRHFFMPEEDRHGFAEGMRRGGYMVAADTDEHHAHRVMDVLEESGAVDLDAEEARWRSEGWRGYQAGTGTDTAAATGSAAATGGTSATTVPPVPGGGSTPASRTGSTTGTKPSPSAMSGTAADRSSAESQTRRDVDEAETLHERAAATPPGTGAGAAGRDAVTGTDERIPLVEEHLRVGKRMIVAGRVRIRSYVVETPVTETVHLRQEHVEVEHRPVDRPLGASEADPFREREIEATESREEPVVSKDTRVREELVLHKSAEERDETVRDTVRHTEVHEDRGEAGPDMTNADRNPGSARRP